VAPKLHFQIMAPLEADNAPPAAVDHGLHQPAPTESNGVRIPWCLASGHPLVARSPPPTNSKTPTAPLGGPTLTVEPSGDLVSGTRANRTGTAEDTTPNAGCPWAQTAPESPFNGELIPIWIADYVLAEYGPAR